MTSAAALHDVGKIAIPDAILLKPGKLTDEEFSLMKTHCARGCSILEQTPEYWDTNYLSVCMDICRHHHEKYDGRGYPDGLAGDEIPIAAQIVSIADCYDALTTERPYKKAFSHEKACDMILNGECGCFSPELLDCFRACLDAFATQAEDPGSGLSQNRHADRSSAIRTESLADTRILLAEDNALSREIAVDILEGEGAAVVAVGNGQLALEAFRDAPDEFDAILMDIQMPEMNGPEAAEAIRALPTPSAATVPIIALTASSEDSDVERCLEAGMDAYLTKPVAIAALTRVLLDCMRSRSELMRKKLRRAEILAKQDGLTGVKNVAAYKDAVKQLSQTLQSDPQMKLAVVGCDINDLKEVNDRQGHDVGDLYIQYCCGMICRVFKHSPVYRIGGDEFVVILSGEDYERREELLQELRSRMSASTELPDVPEAVLGLACGLAVYDPASGMSVPELIKAADNAMYENKNQMKAEGASRREKEEGQ
jgi:putative two-component system response regulator